ncbi:MAG TPA: adenylate/guanylate cyclase domain-containing protein [Pseudonocardia sp.]|jgi:adenylate cyclase
MAPDQRDALNRRIEEIILQAPKKYTRTQVLELTGMDEVRAKRLWRSLGFADVGDAPAFTDRDLEAVARVEELRATGLVSSDLQDAVIRSMAQAMAGLTDWQVSYLYHVLEERGTDPRAWPLNLRQLLPELEGLQEFIWRRHLAVAAGRLLASAPDEADLRTLTVGSVDLVGFTRTVRRISPTQLVELVELFHGIASDAIADHNGRLVKTVGDAVLFVTDHPEDAALIALDLLDRTGETDGLPELRTGLALGPVLTRFGDIYGEVVENASRLCTHARPGRILVDRQLEEALRADPRFALRIRRPLVERGYPRLQSWGLRRSTPAQEK